MRRGGSLAGLASLAILLGAFSAAAVSRANGPATTSSRPAPGAGTTNNPGDDVHRDLDLPIEKPAPKQATPVPPAPIEPPPPAPGPNPPIDGDGNPPTFYGQEIKSENATIIYVIDISNSMMMDAPQPYLMPDGGTATGHRLDRAKAELVKSIMLLPSTFKFNVFSYDCTIAQWQQQVVPADTDDKNGACAWVMSLVTDRQKLKPAGTGGTATGPAVRAALGDRANKCIELLTDGEPNCLGPYDTTYYLTSQDELNRIHRDMIRTGNTQHAVINVFGIAADKPLMRQFCVDVATDSGGSYTDVR